MRERILGTECEYALFHQLPSRSEAPGVGTDKWRSCSLPEHLKVMSALLISVLSRKNWPRAGEFLANGGRFYIDRGSHPEYATPECRSVQDLVAHEKAGDRIVYELVNGARELMAQEGIPGELHIFKNNLDGHGNTYGSHENYLVTPRAMEQIENIVPFLLTRQIYAGAGKVLNCADPVRTDSGFIGFRLSQRADFIDRIYSDRTSETRGIINTRKREIRRRGQNLRLHIILGDSNLCEYALGLKIGTTALVLRMLEEDALGQVPVFSQPVAALKEIARDVTGVHPMQEGSARYTALDVQNMYLDRAQKFFASCEPDTAEREMLTLWENTLLGLKNLKLSYPTGTIEDDPGQLKRKLDWVLKLWLLNRTREKRQLAWNDPQLRHLDFRYHDLDPVRSLYERCAALDLVDRMVTEEKISLARQEPPQDTRAWLRGSIIRETQHRNVEVIVKDWESIKIVAKGNRPAASAHPFDRQRRLVNSFKADLQNPFEYRNPLLLGQINRFVAMWDGQ